MAAAALIWIREEMHREEDGVEQWNKFITWVNTPPSTSGDRPTGPAVPSQAAQIRARARAQVGDQGAAFAAFIES